MNHFCSLGSEAQVGVQATNFRGHAPVVRLRNGGLCLGPQASLGRWRGRGAVGGAGWSGGAGVGGVGGVRQGGGGLM